MEYQKILTQDFVTIKIPVLSGTEKQIKFGEKIRRKYIDIFNKKLNQYNIFDKKGRDEFTKTFSDFLNLDETSKSSYWINNHCAFCGSKLIHQNGKAVCSNDYCNYEKKE